MHPGTRVALMYVCQTLLMTSSHVSYSQSHTHLKHLRSRLIVRFGILDQQIYIFSHGTDAPVVTQLEANT